MASRSQPEEPNLTCIKRVDSEKRGEHGWQVAVQRRNKRVWRSFGDKRHGGREASLAAAMACRDELVEEAETYSLREFAELTARGRNSGHTGVYRHERVAKDGRVYCVFQAYWPETPGKRRGIDFSSLTYGEDRALELAVAARQRAMERLERDFRDLTETVRTEENEPSEKDVEIDPRIKRVRAGGRRLALELADGRLISAPIFWFPTLAALPPEDRHGFVLEPDERGVVWPGLGLSVRVTDLLSPS